MNTPACGQSVKITIKNSGHRRKLRSSVREEMQRRRMNMRPRKHDTVATGCSGSITSLAPSFSKLRLPGRRFYPVNTFSL